MPTEGYFSTCFPHQSASVVKLLYQLAKLCCTNNAPQNLTGLQRVISPSCVSLTGWFCFCPMRLLPGNQTDKAASIWTTHSNLSNTVPVMPVVPEKLSIAYLFTLDSVHSHFQIFLVWTINCISPFLSRLLTTSWQRKKRHGKNTNWLLKVSGQK